MGGIAPLWEKTATAWQNKRYILGLFGGKVLPIRRHYRVFVEKGIADGKRQELTGVGLIRSVGGWEAVKALRKANALQKGDERILGDGDFVEKALSAANEALEKKYFLLSQGYNLDGIALRVAEVH